MAPPLFTPAGYRDLLRVALSAGYRFGWFGEAPDDGVLYLRHDVDKSLEWSVAMAEIEAELNVQSTWFFLLHSPLYSLLEPSAVAAVQRLRALGHRIALHCDTRRMQKVSGDLSRDVRDEIALLEALVGQAERVVSFHNPEPAVIRRPVSGVVSTYAPNWMPPSIKYISDSNRNFREGDPRIALRAGRWSSLHLLIHPIWHMAQAPTAIDALRMCVLKRRQALAEYLRYSNHVWAQSVRVIDD